MKKLDFSAYLVVSLYYVNTYLMETSKHPQWAVSHRGPGTELRCLKGRYYLYSYTTVYDKEKKGSRKISGKLLGRITEKQGFIPSGKRKLEKALDMTSMSKPTCMEFGVAFLITEKFTRYIELLKTIFPGHWRSILAIAYCRFVYRCPLKSIPFRLSGSYLPELIGSSAFNEKTSSFVLKTIGGMHEQKLNYMKSFISNDEYLLMDSTHVFSNSTLITLARKGYNNQLNFDTQFNLMYIYSAKTSMPVYYRLLPGNIREVKAFKNCLLEVGLKDAIIIADKGFHSGKNVELLLKEELKFILPLKRDNVMIDYSLLANNTFKENNSYFVHEKRIIWYQEYYLPDDDRLSLFLFLDEALRVKEEKDYLERIVTHPESYSLEQYHQRRNAFGTIAMLTALRRKSAEDIYLSYKSRMTIEVLFDGMKNVLEADHTYMQDEQTLHGWMFINHITLQWYQELYTELKAKGLLKVYSVNDYIQMLTDLKKIRINGLWYFNEITKNSSRMMEKLGLSYE
jgi:transposase